MPDAFRRNGKTLRTRMPTPRLSSMQKPGCNCEYNIYISTVQRQDEDAQDSVKPLPMKYWRTPLLNLNVINSSVTGHLACGRFYIGVQTPVQRRLDALSIHQSNRGVHTAINESEKPSGSRSQSKPVPPETEIEPTEEREIVHEFIADDIVEAWSELTPAPTQGQRIFANRFFETSKYPPKRVFTASEIYQAKHTGIPEIAVIGRANVGKSSLINALLGRKIASTSSQPGHTRALHAWGVGGPDGTGWEWRLTVVDMPGYGQMIRKEWGDTIKKYLDQRRELRRVYVLINAQHGVTAYDKVAIQLLRESSIPHQIVLTKVDKLFTKHGGNSLPKSRLRAMMRDSTQQKTAQSIRQQVAEIREICKPRRGELPAVESILAVSSMARNFPVQAPNKKETLGITALRWSILDAIGIRSARSVQDETDMTFDAQ